MNDDENKYDIEESYENEDTYHNVKRDYYTDDEKKDKLNDIVITQCILCLIVVVGMLVLNVFYPDISRELIEKYKQYSGNSDSEAIYNAVNQAVQTFSGFIK